MAPYTAKYRADIQAAKEKADVVIFYPHVGGQFNPEPGAVARYVVEQGADAVIASHSHIVQKAPISTASPAPAHWVISVCPPTPC